MIELFADMPEAIEMTNEIVAKVEQFKLGRDILLPKFEIAQAFIEENEAEIQLWRSIVENKKDDGSMP